MHWGIIADRYAKAFMAYTDAHSISENVIGQVSVLLSLLGRVEKFRNAVSSNSKEPLEERISLIRAAVEPQVLDESVERLYRLMDSHGRSAMFRMALLDYITMYRKDRKIRMVLITSATKDDTLPEYIAKIIENAFDEKVVMMHHVNPDIIGGFVVDSWGYRIDASVKGLLEKARKQMMENNRKRIA